MNLEDIVEPLLSWYDHSARDLPWRRSPTAYHVWISEIMLQQTRVEAVKEYYKRFLEKYPDVFALSRAQEEDLLKVWEGLGYYNRVRNMQKAARRVVVDYEGNIPRSYDLLLNLPGIGNYTAGAVASIAFNLPVPAVDGNVLRVLMRVMGSYEDIKSERTKRETEKRLLVIMPTRAGAFNQAFMDLGATICIPNGEPRCDLCPLSSFCEARRLQLTDTLPVQTKKKPRTIVRRTVLILSTSLGMALQKRPDKGLLAGMYEPPCLSEHCSESEVLSVLREWGYHPIKIERAEDNKHVFTHKEWHMISYKVRLDNIQDEYKVDEKNHLFFVTANEMADRYPFPSAFSVYRKYFGP